MAPDLCSVCGILGMGGCLYAMTNTLRAAYLTCVSKVHVVSLTRFAEAHTKAVSKMGNIEVEIESFTEDVIEVVGPFLN